MFINLFSKLHQLSIISLVSHILIISLELQQWVLFLCDRISDKPLTKPDNRNVHGSLHYWKCVRIGEFCLAHLVVAEDHVSKHVMSCATLMISPLCTQRHIYDFSTMYSASARKSSRRRSGVPLPSRVRQKTFNRNKLIITKKLTMSDTLSPAIEVNRSINRQTTIVSGRFIWSDIPPTPYLLPILQESTSSLLVWCLLFAQDSYVFLLT